MSNPNFRKLDLTIIAADWPSGEALGENLKGLYDVELITAVEQYRLVRPSHTALVDLSIATIPAISEMVRDNPGQVICFYNVPDNAAIVPYLCIQGVNGMFLKGENLSVVHKGLLALRRGELFFPRGITALLLERIKLDQGHSAIEISRLSRKEQEILKTLSMGKTNNDIAREMNLSFHTVKTHVYNIYKKLNVNNRAEATRLAQSVFM